MARVRMTLMYEFDWAFNEVTQEDADDMVRDFYTNPTTFIHPLEDDEELYVHIEEVNDCND